MLAAEETGLQREVPLEGCEPSHDPLDRQLFIHRQVDPPHHLVRPGVEFEDPVVASLQGLDDILSA